VKFFDAKGARRDADAVLRDIKVRYDRLKTDQSRAKFVEKAFGQADLDTIKGIRSLLQGDILTRTQQFSGLIQNAGGTLNRDLKDAINNAIDQTGRLRAALREAADDFAQPIKDAYTGTIQKMLNEKKKGGLELSGKQLLLGGGALAAGTLAAAFLGNKIAKRLAGTGAGILEGKAIEKIAGVTPVFVVNWPAGMGGGSVLDTSAAAAKDLLGKTLGRGVDAAMKGMLLRGAGFIAGNVALPAVAGVAAYDITSKINEAFGDPSGAFGRWLYDFTHPEPQEITIRNYVSDNRTTSIVEAKRARVRVENNRGSFLGK
jgi:hypothetical protein